MPRWRPFAFVDAVLGDFVGRTYGVVVGPFVSVAAPFCGYVVVWLAERVRRIGSLLEG
jgi:hypothetical protein